MDIEDLKEMFRPKPSAVQPDDGDLVLHCGHRADVAHQRIVNRTWYFKEPRRFAVRAGERRPIHWFACCDDCWLKSGRDLEQVAFSALGRWTAQANGLVLMEPVGRG